MVPGVSLLSSTLHLRRQEAWLELTSLRVRPKMAAEKLGHLREVASEIGGKKRSQQAKNEMTFSQVINIADLRRLAQSRVPKVVFDYLDGGAEDEITLRENCRSFQDVTSRPRHAVAVGDCDLRTRVLGTEIAFPALLAGAPSVSQKLVIARPGMDSISITASAMPSAINTERPCLS